VKGASMTDEQISDYTLLCPDSRHKLFHDAARLLISAHQNMREPAKLSRGQATIVNADLKRLKDAINKLSPETRRELMFRELEYLENHQDDITNRIFGDVFSGDDDDLRHRNANRLKDLLKAAVFEDVDGSLRRLSAATQHTYQNKKSDRRITSLTDQAAIRWQMHGGVVTDAEGYKTFPAFLEALLDDLEWSANSRVLTKNYLKTK
jgi:hypothetical protein